MDRAQILAVVIKHIKLNIDGLDDVEIDPTRNIVDYGASSLDGVEIVSASMRELQIRIPRTEVANFKTINDLVDRFDQAQHQVPEETSAS